VRELLDALPEDLRQRALTHPAFARAHSESFERLEFLGDSVLGLAVTEAIFTRYPDLSEGELTKVRAGVVSRDACEIVAREQQLGAAMVVQAAGRGAAFEATAKQLAEQRNALAALVESIAGAGFLHLGYEAVASHVLAAFEDRIEYALENRVDARSRLQELASREGVEVTWQEVGEEGPPHDRRFTVSAHIATDFPHRAEGTGRSKQEAQQAAAAAVLAQIEEQG